VETAVGSRHGVRADALKPMSPDQGSRTVLRPALLRAAHQLLDDDPKVLVDPVAVGFVPEVSAAAIRARTEELLSSRARMLRALMVVRSRYAEDRLTQALRRGVRQYVVLGAGLDTFAWRQPEEARISTLFYVDHPATLAATRSAIAAQGHAAPRNLRWISCDLEVDDLAAALAGGGFVPREPVFASALGLFQYLQPATVERILSAASRWARGSELVFTHVVPTGELDDDERAEHLASATASASLAEPWLTCWPGAAWRDRLHALDFTKIETLGAEKAQDAYLLGRSDGLRMPRFEALMSAM
jgi:methyltransferase (TIGR00027 family)